MSEMSRRDFLKKAGITSLAGVAAGWITPSLIQKAVAKSTATLKPTALAQDESFWADIRDAYQLSNDFVNLESGNYSATSKPVLQRCLQHSERINKISAKYMREQRDEDHEETRKQLARFVGCSVDELVITRNTTEALNIVLLGVQLKPKQAILAAKQEYGRMLHAIDQRERREGTKAVLIDTPIWNWSDEEIIAAYRDALEKHPEIGLVLVSHMCFYNGQVLPVKAICDLAHEYGAEVVVDAAHSFSHLQEKPLDLDCDYYGTSLHKWMGAPLGTGFLYMKANKVSKVWPLFGVGKDYKRDDDIHKFESVGTRPEGIELAIRDAITFNEAIGSAAKEERLRYLQRTWVDRLADVDGISFSTPFDGRRSCAMADVKVKGLKTSDLAEILFQKHGFYAADYGGLGLRVAPNLWTKTEDLERFGDVLADLA